VAKVTVQFTCAECGTTSGRWLDIVGPRAMLGIAIAMGMTGALLTLAPSAAIVIAGLALCCSSVFIAQATASTHLGAAAAHDRGVAVGLYATFYYLGGSAGGALPALFWDRGGWPACVALVVVVQAATVSIGVLWRAGGGNVRIEEIEPVP